MRGGRQPKLTPLPPVLVIYPLLQCREVEFGRESSLKRKARPQLPRGSNAGRFHAVATGHQAMRSRVDHGESRLWCGHLRACLDATTPSYGSHTTAAAASPGVADPDELSAGPGRPALKLVVGPPERRFWPVRVLVGRRHQHRRHNNNNNLLPGLALGVRHLRLPAGEVQIS